MLARACAAARRVPYAALLAGMVVFATSPARPADNAWPTRTIRLVVAQAPGGAPDLVARYPAVRLAAQLGTAVIVQNVAGASATIGAEQVAHARWADILPRMEGIASR